MIIEMFLVYMVSAFVLLLLYIIADQLRKIRNELEILNELMVKISNRASEGKRQYF